MLHRIMNLVLATAALIGIAAVTSAQAQTRRPTPPKSLRLYVLDCGKIENGYGIKLRPWQRAVSATVNALLVHEMNRGGT